MDLSQVTFLDSTGLGALHAEQPFEDRDKRLALRGVTPPVSKILAITGLDKAFGLSPAADARRC